MGGGRKTRFWLALAFGGAWLLHASGCLPSAAEGSDLGSAGKNGGGQPSPGTTASVCRQELAYCETRCGVSADCTNSSNQGGHECLFFPGDAMERTSASPTSMTGATEGERAASVPDAGAHNASDDDAGANGGHTLVSTKTGSCARACSTALCPDPRMVCSSKDAGRCRFGCDETRPYCDPGQACDFDSKLCKNLEGVCESTADCGWFDAQLKDKGTISCEDRRCRLHLNSPDFVELLHSRISSTEPEPLQVLAPLPGARIRPSELSSYSFQFEVPAKVIVVSVLTREIKSLEDGAAAARWIAYVDHSAALDGVTLADGGENYNGDWHRYERDAVPMLPVDTQLYLLVLGYDDEQLVAKSELVPFKVSEPIVQPRTPCNGSNGDFCGDSGLVCADGLCRTPCLSDLDCAGQDRPCSEPGLLGIKARLCF